MIFKLPTPLLGQTHAFIYEVLEGGDRLRPERHIRLTLMLGSYVGEELSYIPTMIRRWIRGPELAAFEKEQASKGAPAGDWRKSDLVNWITRHGVEHSPHRVTPDIINPSNPAPSFEPVPEPLRTRIWRFLNKPIHPFGR